MPPRKPVEALKQLCFPTIARNIDMYPTKAIHSLPTSLLEELIEFTHDINLLDRHELLKTTKAGEKFIQYKTHLITENITRLSLSFWYVRRVNIAFVLNSIPKHFKNLKQFNCEGEITKQEILNLVHSIPNVIDLKLYSIELDDDILEAIGDNCPNLERLDLTWGDITDVGLSRLCNSKSRGSNITHLRLGESDSHTINGCLVVLQNLKRLKVFDIWCLIKAFVKLFQDLNGSPELPTFQLCKLREIFMDPPDYVPMGFFDFLTKCCPNVSNLNLWVSNNSSNKVIELKECEKILLEISNYGELSMSHLADVGSKVTSLHLGEINVDLELMGYTCPNLKELKLYTVTYQPIVNLKRSNRVIPFRKLQKLIINNTIHVPQLKFLFQNCVELEHLELYCAIPEGNVDNFFSIIRKINSLRHLSHFTIESSTAVCKLVVLEFLKMENNLQFVTTGLDNHLLSEYRVNCEIESYIKENNLGITYVTPKINATS